MVNTNWHAVAFRERGMWSAASLVQVRLKATACSTLPPRDRRSPRGRCGVLGTRIAFFRLALLSPRARGSPISFNIGSFIGDSSIGPGVQAVTFR